MNAQVTISIHALGQTNPLLPDWALPLPPDFSSSGESLTLREVIRRVVCGQVRAFGARQRNKRFISVLTERQIAEGVEAGRVIPGGRDLNQPVDEDAATATTWQAFEDGLYLVILDGEEQRELDRQVWLAPDSRLVFVRLTFLAGA